MECFNLSVICVYEVLLLPIQTALIVATSVRWPNMSLLIYIAQYFADISTRWVTSRRKFRNFVQETKYYSTHVKEWHWNLKWQLKFTKNLIITLPARDLKISCRVGRSCTPTRGAQPRGKLLPLYRWPNELVLVRGLLQSAHHRKPTTELNTVWQE